MLALAEWRALQCPGCGGHLPDTTDPAGDGAYTTPPPERCHRCTALATAQHLYRESPHPQALLFVTRDRRRG